MATPEFVYQDPLPLEKDTTKYRLLTKDYVSVSQFEGKDILKIAPEGLTYLANVAIRDVSFLLRTAHLEKVAAILKDPERFAKRSLCRAGDAAQRRHVIEGHPAVLPGHRHGHRVRQKGPAGVDRREGRGAYRQGDL